MTSREVVEGQNSKTWGEGGVQIFATFHKTGRSVSQVDHQVTPPSADGPGRHLVDVVLLNPLEHAGPQFQRCKKETSNAATTVVFASVAQLYA